MSKQTVVRYECDVPGCNAIYEIIASLSHISLTDGWEVRAEGMHVCPAHVGYTSDQLMEANNE